MSILIDEHTTFIIQGITGREAVTMTRECLDYGAKVIGGVTPGRSGRQVHGLPVEDTVLAFTDRERVDAAVVSVPPAFAADAALEAIERIEGWRALGDNILEVIINKHEKLKAQIARKRV